MAILNQFPPKRLFKHQFISPVSSLVQSGAHDNQGYQKRLKISLAVSLILMLAFLNIFPKQFMINNSRFVVENADLVIEDIPLTQQINRPPPPSRPSVPIPTEDVEVPEDLTMGGTEIDFSELPPPPPAPEESGSDMEYQFIAYDRTPEPVGGFQNLLNMIKYPELAKRAGVESNVIVGALIDPNGDCLKTVILKNSGTKLGFEEAAQTAVMKIKWKPAFQRDKPIKVWVSVPISFILN